MYNGTVKINNNLFDFLIGALFKKKNYMKGTHFECQMQVISSKDLNARTIESRLEQVIAQTQLVKTQNRRRHNAKLVMQSGPCGAVVRAEAQGSSDLCVPGSNPTLGCGCQSFGRDRVNRGPASQYCS